MESETWDIALKNHLDADGIIVYGYARQLAKQNSRFMEETGIYNIILTYYHIPNNIGSFKWIIDDKLLTDINNTQDDTHFLSPTFDVASCKWQIVIFPNGFQENRRGSFDIALHLVKLSEKWKNITVTKTLSAPQTYSSITEMTTFTENYCDAWPTNTLRFKELKESKYKQYIFTVDIIVTKIILKDNDKMYYNMNMNYINHQQMHWKIDSKLMKVLKRSDVGKRISSKIYNNMWSIHLCPNGYRNKYNGEIVICLALCGLGMKVPTKIKWNVVINELNINKTATDTFIIDDEYILMRVGSFEEFKKCDSINIIVDVSMLELM